MPPPLSYQDAGVSIDAGNQLVESIKETVQKTHTPAVLGGIGGFGALYDLGTICKNYTHPLLVSGTDGVGTKLTLATELNNPNGIGIDLVAMCANDILTSGAKPLFFLDYYATGKLNPKHGSDMIKSIAEGCLRANMSLVGGETAEMPGLYQNNDYDLAGFCVGVVDKPKLIDGKNLKPGDKLIALPSSGPHSNGYSLIRTILKNQPDWATQILSDGTPLPDALLKPTTIYVNMIQNLIKSGAPIHGMAHITGGGLIENAPRMLPSELKIIIDKNSWQLPEIFTWLKDHGPIENKELYRTFNCGIGYLIAVPSDSVKTILNTLGNTAWICGEIAEKTSQEAAFLWA